MPASSEKHDPGLPDVFAILRRLGALKLGKATQPAVKVMRGTQTKHILQCRLFSHSVSGKAKSSQKDDILRKRRGGTFNYLSHAALNMVKDEDEG